MTTKTEVEEQTTVKAEKKSAHASDKLSKILDTIEQLTVIELSQLVKALEEKFGVSAQAAVSVAAPAAGGAGAQAAGAAEEKTAFQVILTSAGPTKIQVIKEIRTVTSLGLKEAKDLVEAAPKMIKDNATKEEAAKMKQVLEAAGAKVEIK